MIEPVKQDKKCTNVAEMFGSEEFICSYCGVYIQAWSAQLHEGGEFEEYSFDFCPHCGRKVVPKGNVDIADLVNNKEGEYAENE